MNILRESEIQDIRSRFRHSPVVALLGPRQCGKTTLSRQYYQSFPKESVHVFDLEDPQDLARLENPMLALKDLKGLVVIDEIQKQENLFSTIRVLSDNNPETKYLILGSASRDLIRQSSETLAGRVSYIEMSGFHLNHLPADDWKMLWIRGGFPRSYLAPDLAASVQWRKDFIQTFLEKDIPNLGLNISPLVLRRFWTMLAHYHGQIFEAGELAKSLGVSGHTIKHYLDILTGTFVVRQLTPFFYNTKKRLVKRPKIFIRDSGLMHALLSLDNQEAVMRHPKLGASWEGFALEEVIAHFKLEERDIFFWSVHTGAEVDLLFQRNGKMYAVEFKYTDVPRVTPSMISAAQEFNLEKLWVVYPGDKAFPLTEKISAVGLPMIGSVMLNETGA